MSVLCILVDESSQRAMISCRNGSLFTQVRTQPWGPKFDWACSELRDARSFYMPIDNNSNSKFLWATRNSPYLMLSALLHLRLLPSLHDFKPLFDMSSMSMSEICVPFEITSVRSIISRNASFSQCLISNQQPSLSVEPCPILFSFLLSFIYLAHSGSLSSITNW